MGSSRSRMASLRSALSSLPLGNRVFVTVAALAASGSTTLVFNAVLAHVLSINAYGSIARTLALSFGLAQLSMSSVAPTLAWNAAQGLDDPARHERARAALRHLLISALVCSSLFPVAALLGLAPFDFPSVFLGCAFVLIYPVYFGQKLLLYAVGEINEYAKLEFTSDFLFLLLLVVLASVATRYSLAAFVIAYGVFVVRATRRFKRAPVESGGPAASRLVRYAILTFTGTYASAARFPIVVVLVGAVSTAANAGRTAALFSLTLPLFLLPQAAGMVTFADVARNLGGDTAGRVKRATRGVLLMSATAILIVVALSGPLLRLALGPRFLPLENSLIVLVVGILPLLAATPTGNALAAEGKVALTAGISALGLVLALIGTAILVPPFGTEGAAIAVGVAVSVQGLTALGAGVIFYHLDLADLLPGGLLTGASGLCGFGLNVAAPTELVLLVGAFALALFGWVIFLRRSRPSGRSRTGPGCDTRLSSST